MMLRLLALSVGLVSAADSDMCATASAYTSDSESAIGGCESGSMCSNGFWTCDGIATMYLPKYASAVTACSQTTNSELFGNTEAAFTKMMTMGCCSDGVGVCDPDYSSICQDPTTYDGSASSLVSGCSAGSDVCDNSGYWKCDSAMDFVSSAYTISACGSTMYQSSMTEAEYTSMLGNTCCSDATSVCGTWDDPRVNAATAGATACGSLVAITLAAVAAVL